MKNRIILGIPIAAIVFYCIVIAGMAYSEGKLTDLYERHIALITELEDKGNKQEALASFAKDVKLNAFEETVLSVSAKLQRAVDEITPGRIHCLSTTQYQNCIVYTQSLVDSAQKRQEKISSFGGKPMKESILAGEKMTARDFAIKSGSIVFIALLFSALILCIKLLRK